MFILSVIEVVDDGYWRNFERKGLLFNVFKLNILDKINAM